eukprot:COSAG04_NODE_242_length_19007_cov_3.089433_9_plen_115_part_00
MIAGRGALAGLEPESQIWESGIAFTMIGTTFFHNWAGFWGGSLLVVNAWPFVGAVSETNFAHNEALLGPQDAYLYDPSVRTPLPLCVHPPHLNLPAYLSGGPPKSRRNSRVHSN